MQPSDSSHKHMTHGAGAGMRTSYSGLFVSIAVSFVVMFGLMYSMADSASNVYFNLSNVYMTGLMAGSMLPVMLATMPGMFMDRRINLALWAISAAALLLFWLLLRNEAGVGDRQFMRAMIPHHSAAIQMCEESSLSDTRVKKLCDDIITSQRQEIATMKALLAEKQ